MNTLSSENNNLSNAYEDSLQIFKYLKEKAKNIIIFTITVTLIGIIYAISIPNLYTSKSLLFINDNSSSGQSSSGGDILQALTGFAGSSPQALSRANVIIERIRSRDFLMHLEEKYNISPAIMSADHYDKKAKKLVYESGVYDEASDTYTKDYPFQDFHGEFLTLIGTDYFKDKNLLRVSVTHISPYFAEMLVRAIINEVNLLQREYDFKESTSAIKYLQGLSLEVDQLELKMTISELLKIELKKQMLTDIREDYSITPLDNPYFPDAKSSPFRALMTIIFFVGGLILATFYYIFIFYLKSQPSVKH